MINLFSDINFERSSGGITGVGDEEEQGEGRRRNGVVEDGGWGGEEQGRRAMGGEEKEVSDRWVGGDGEQGMGQWK